MIVTVINESGRRVPPGTQRFVTAVVRKAARDGRASVPDEVTVKIVDDRRMKDFNRRYKGRAYPTDVLSFPTGDMVISHDAASRQAPEAGHSVRREIVHLACHGMLHLLGWNDDTEPRRDAMEAETVRILESCRVK